MKYTILAVALMLPASVYAQTPSAAQTQQAAIVSQLKAQLGELMFNNATLAAEVNDLNGRIADLSTKLSEATKKPAESTAPAKEKPKGE